MCLVYEYAARLEGSSVAHARQPVRRNSTSREPRHSAVYRSIRRLWAPHNSPCDGASQGPIRISRNARTETRWFGAPARCRRTGSPHQREHRRLSRSRMGTDKALHDLGRRTNLPHLCAPTIDKLPSRGIHTIHHDKSIVPLRFAAQTGGWKEACPWSPLTIVLRWK
jgi:hypothetical protein